MPLVRKVDDITDTVRSKCAIQTQHEALLASICGAPGNVGAIHKWRDCEDRNHRTPRSLQFDVGCSDYLGPFFGIIRNELSEFGR